MELGEAERALRKENHPVRFNERQTEDPAKVQTKVKTSSEANTSSKQAPLNGAPNDAFVKPPKMVSSSLALTITTVGPRQSQ